MEEKNIMIRPIRGGISNIDENPIDALEKLGKYEFIYDYSAINRLLFAVPNTLKPLSSNANTGFYNFDGDGTGLPANFSYERLNQLFSQPVKVNSEAQVGVFSKGNIVNVLRFDGNNAIIENVNYKAPDPNIKKTWFGELLGGVINKKELSIPKDYLRKVDDTLDATILTGINYGANMKPQPVYDMPPVKTIPQLSSDVIIEENASFVLNQDYRYTKNTYCPPYARCVAPPQFTIKSGTKVAGRLIRRNNNDSYMTPAGFIAPNTYFTFLEAKGVGVDGSINIPIDYLTRVEPKPYLVVQDFIIYSRWENRMGQSGVQELPYSKGGVIFLPTTTHQDQFDIALKGGKLQELPIVSVVSLVDKQVGKCISDGALIQTTEYNPCKTVKKGEILTGYIANGVFTNTNKDIMKPQLSFGEYKLVQTNSGAVVPEKYDNKDLLMIAGAFLLGYALFRKSNSSN